MVAHIFSLAFIAAIAFFSLPGSSLFSWHPFLMTIGYVGFLFQAILVFSKESSLFSGVKHKNKVTLHWILNALGVFSILVAYAAIYYHKEEIERPHFKSWHGTIGIFTIGYTVIQFIAGHNLTIFNFFIRKFVKYQSLCMYHATSGTFLYVLACVSISLGICSNWFSESTPFYVGYLCFAITAMLGLIVTNQF
ncbi:cytochrome b561 domain-containing 2 [Brachionus plicatilis]|uniref:ascorbate ferrireductase (transmembrane) n=1 Tax=Brachionus plicatilis TaxID=10195 RepID=A0A3M7SKN0_BRAPC|nr:cytochrome b561 domain-containing 2 [Brachionus plicatilis]